MIEDAYKPMNMSDENFDQMLQNNYIEVLQTEVRQLRDCLKNALIVVMHNYSMTVHGESWAKDVDIEAPKNDDLVYNMAKLTGYVPYWSEGQGLKWRKFREFRNGAEN